MTKNFKASILVGENCNFRCEHCLFKNKRESKLTNKEKNLITSEISKHNINRILFTGGEPSLYINDINYILRKLKDLQNKEIIVTTNGSFATSANNTRDILSSFIKIDKIQVSYDIFHSKFLKIENIKNLYLTCKKMNKDFSVILTIQSPLDLKLVKKLKNIGNFPIGIQKVLPIGMAIENNVYYKYLSFDKNVLSKKCPGIKEIIYICGKGWTICCSNLIYNGIVQKITYKSIDALKESWFYKLMYSYNFGQIVKLLNIPIRKLLPNCSSECNLCEYIFTKYGEKNEI